MNLAICAFICVAVKPSSVCTAAASAWSFRCVYYFPLFDGFPLICQHLTAPIAVPPMIPIIPTTTSTFFMFRLLVFFNSEPCVMNPVSCA